MNNRDKFSFGEKSFGEQSWNHPVHFSESSFELLSLLYGFSSLVCYQNVIKQSMQSDILSWSFAHYVGLPLERHDALMVTVGCQSSGPSMVVVRDL